MDSRKILIVDDNADIRLGMHLRLKANHYETFFAADAFAAVAEARKHRPDLIILDLGLPAGDGFTVMERLSQIPFLAVFQSLSFPLATDSVIKSGRMKQERKHFFKNP